MTTSANILGRALSAPARTRMLRVLMDGNAHAAGALATAAGVRPPTASGHLAVLLEAGLVEVASRGRFREYRIADWSVAEMLESLDLPAAPAAGSLRWDREHRRLRAARTCYDHLAGQLGVAVSDALRERGWLDGAGDRVTSTGVSALIALGLDLEALSAARRPLVRQCRDWTEGRMHLAGGLGAAMTRLAADRQWVRPISGSRALEVTGEGRAAFEELLEVRVPAR